MTPKLEIKNVSKFFGDTQVLNDVDFSIGDGEFVSIVGTSGCGKTAGTCGSAAACPARPSPGWSFDR